MATVIFCSELQEFTAEERIQTAASNYRDLIAALLNRYPRLKQSQLDNMAVAIDGEIITDPLLESIGTASEVHFLHFIAGG